MGTYFSDREKTFILRIKDLPLDGKKVVPLDALPVSPTVVKALRKNSIRTVGDLWGISKGKKINLAENGIDLPVESVAMLTQLLALLDMPPRGAKREPVQQELVFPEPKKPLEFRSETRERETLANVMVALRQLADTIEEVLQ